MPLTRDQITAGAAYAIRLDPHRLSGKRFRDAIALVKSIGTRPDTSSAYDGATRTWTVILPADSVGGLADVQTLASAYSADVEVGGLADVQTHAGTAAAGRSAGPGAATRAASKLYGVDMAEYGSGFGPDEMS